MRFSTLVAFLTLVVLAMATPTARSVRVGCVPPAEASSSSGGPMRQVMACGEDDDAESWGESSPEYEDDVQSSEEASPEYADYGGKPDEGFDELWKWVQQCFPADSEVQVKSHGTLKLHELETGHLVRQSNGEFSPVFAFTHREAHGVFPFRRLCASHSSCVTASHGHYIFGDRQLVAAGAVRVGDGVQLSNGSLARVRSAETVWRRGLFHPHTSSGELVVDGFRVSAYTTSVRPAAARGLLAPLRAAFATLGVDVTRGRLHNVGSRWTALAALRGAAATSIADAVMV